MRRGSRVESRESRATASGDGSEGSCAPVRLGVVGCSGSRQTYGGAIRYVDDLQVTALVDPDLVAARSWLRNSRGIPIFEVIDALPADAPVDAVLVTSPPPLRAAHAAAAARSGRHVLLERPVAHSLTGLTDLESAVAESGVVAYTGFAKRHDTAFRTVADLLADGAIGEPSQVRCDWSFCAEWEEHRTSLRTWPGVFRELASHTVDVCRWWLGDIHTVSADVDVPETATRKLEIANLILGHERGVSVHHLARTTRRNAVEQYLIRGSRGALHLAMTAGWSYLSAEPFRVTLHRRGEEPQDLTRVSLGRIEVETGEHNPYRRILAEFASRVEAGTPDPEALAASRQALETVYAAYLSTVEKAKFSLPLTHPPDLHDGW